MSDTPEDFEQLRRLLKLKRHEQPPPGFYNKFSDRVIERIERQGSATMEERLWQEAPWLKRLFHLMENNPLAAGGFAATICTLLVGGIVYSQYLDQTPQVIPFAPQGSINVASASKTGDSLTTQAHSSTEALLASGSTNLLYGNRTPASPFDAVRMNMMPEVRPVNYSPSGSR